MKSKQLTAAEAAINAHEQAIGNRQAPANGMGLTVALQDAPAAS
jgi:hypothetical protein